MAKSDSELTAEIVSAYIGNPKVMVDKSDIPALIAEVHEALSKF